MPGPDSFVILGQPSLAKSARRIRLQVAQNPFRLDLSADHRMHVCGPRMDDVQLPAAVLADLFNSLLHQLSSWFVQQSGWLPQFVKFSAFTVFVSDYILGAEAIMFSIDRCRTRDREARSRRW